MKICLAASGGGHLRQAVDLKEVWGRHETALVSEDTIFAQSILSDIQKFYVTPFAIGQIRTIGLLKFLSLVVGNARDARIALTRIRPDVVVTTGAGSVFFFVLFARLTGSRIVLVETLSRFYRLSKFARFSAFFAHVRILQSPSLSRFWPAAAVFDPIRVLPDGPLRKRNLMFVTVGASLPFDRMVDAVVELKRQGKIPERVIVQSGRPRPELVGEEVEVHHNLEFPALLSLLNDASIVVCHGGSGSIIPALNAGCRVVAMPRRPEFSEHFDNHQDEITQVFAMRGLIGVAGNQEELERELDAARKRRPVRATCDVSALCAHLNMLLDGWTAAHAR